jgi:diaminopimelate decarboxylase
MNYSKISQLEKEYGSAFFILDLDQLQKNYHRFINAFSRYYRKVKVGYSYKTNYIPRVVQKMNEMGAYAEVVSKMEYQLALQCGVRSERIIFNGPLKDTPDLEYALTHHSILNIDNLAELQRVLIFVNSHPDQAFQVGLRCNFDLKDGSYSRFGLCLENGDLENAFNMINSTHNCRTVGLHCHYTTHGRTLESFHYRTTKMVEISKKLFQDKPPAYLNLGGGIFGRMDEQIKPQFDCHIPSYEEYAETIAPVLKRAYPDEEPELIMEPGVGLVSNVLHFYTRILHLKKIRDRHYAVCSGSVFNVKPSLHKYHLSIERIPCPDHEHTAITQDYEIVGYTCLEWDKLLEKYHGSLAEGDYIKFLNVGAYTIVFKSPFINYAPPILYSEYQNQPLELAKRGETFEDIFRTYLIKGPS